MFGWHLSFKRFKRFHMNLDSEVFLERKRQNKPNPKPSGEGEKKSF